MLLEQLKQNLLHSSLDFSEDVSPFLQVSYVENSDWVSSIIQRMSARSGENFIHVYNRFQTNCKMPDGMTSQLESNGLLHFSATDEALMYCCKNYNPSIRFTSGEASVIQRPKLSSNSATGRAYLWGHLFANLAKSLGANVSMEELDLESAVLVKNEAGAYKVVFQKLDAEAFNTNVDDSLVKAIKLFHIGLERAGRPLHIKDGDFIDMQNPLFRIYYAKHLVSMFHKQVAELKVDQKVIEDTSIFKEPEAREIACILLLWPMLKEQAYKNVDLRPLFLHAIFLSDCVIKWYNAQCLWDEAFQSKIKGRSFVLNAAALALGEILTLVACPHLE